MDLNGMVLQRVLLYEIGVAPIAEVSVVFCRKDGLNQCKLQLVYNSNLDVCNVLNGKLSQMTAWKKEKSLITG